MSDYPEVNRDKLEAYPLRLNVAALPERRFFKMTRTLTVLVVLLSALLIVLAVFLNYQITHLNVTVRRGSNWQFYTIDPEQKKLLPLESSGVSVDPMRLVIEEKLMDYLKIRNSTYWHTDDIEYNFGSIGPIAPLSDPKVFDSFQQQEGALNEKMKNASLIRDTHVYTLKWVNTNLWMALIETFDLPVINDVTECLCTDNSRSCLQCKITHAKNRERKKIWMRTSFKRRGISQQMCEAIQKSGTRVCVNPLGISIDKYISTTIPIHPEAAYWDLPPALRPEI